MSSPDKISIAMFTGGRGTQSITQALLKYPYVSLTLLVNTYDDGLSTGRLRAFVPGMLGPSDVRKNVSRLIPEIDASHRALQRMIEYRLPAPCAADEAVRVLRAIAPGVSDFPLEDLRASFLDLNQRHLRSLTTWTQQFLEYWEKEKKRGVAFDFGDCSLGNIFFVGCYLGAGRDFNEAVRLFNTACETRGAVMNVTDGTNLVLVGLEENGTYLADEAQIVSMREEAPIEDLYLLKEYLPKDQLAGPKEALRARLSQLHQTPRINREAEKVLRSADIIIYGPGTQHSSLFPSYLTADVAEAIAGNAAAEKIFIGNIRKDVEIRHETVDTLVRKLLYYLNRKNTLDLKPETLVSKFFLQDPNLEEFQSPDMVQFNPAEFPFPAERVVLGNWAMGQSAHSGGRVLDEVIHIVNNKTQKKLRPFRYTVSVVVPGLNEAATVRQVLWDLTHLDFSELDVAKEIIYVDGGSTDDSVELARSVPDVKVYSLKDEFGRGAAFRLGIQKATGDMIAFFPSDGEYDAQDLFPVIRGIVKNEFDVVYGSRLIKMVNLSRIIQEIYRGSYLLYLTSKYGGMAVSVLALLLFNRFITDPFTGIKAFDAQVLKSLQLSASGFDIETELLARLGQKQHFVLEVPVNYHPRTRAQGKKTTVLDGVRAISRLLRSRVRPA
jgi:2-phospho-L-lactate transferase/gluconeogenesis factor (CofD/UPF0052 family)